MSMLRSRWRLSAFSLWIALGAYTLGMPVRAAEATRLYQAQAPVAGQDGAARAEAIKAAFKQVLVKITGSRQMPSHPSVQDELANASRYVQQFRYITLDTPEGEQRELQVNFDQGSVDRMLRAKSLPLWGSTRPELLLWLAAESKGQRAFLVPERYKPVYEAAQGQATARGVPLLLPLLDLEDQSALPMGDLWGGFARNIQTASDRYGADAILTGRLTRQGESWVAAWTLIQGERASQWDGRGKSMADVVSQGVNEAGDRLAAQYAPLLVAGAASGPENAVRVWVSGIDGLAGFARVSNYLRSLDGVESMSVRAASPGVAAFTIKMQGGIEALERAVALGSLLMPDALPEAAIAPPPAADRPVPPPSAGSGVTSGVGGTSPEAQPAGVSGAPVEEASKSVEAAAEAGTGATTVENADTASAPSVEASAPALAPSPLPDVPQIAYRVR